MSTNNNEKSSIVDALFDVGTQWASLGLTFGKQALEQSAKSLSTVASSLDAVAKSLAEKPADAAPKGDAAAAAAK